MTKTVKGMISNSAKVNKYFIAPQTLSCKYFVCHIITMYIQLNKSPEGIKFFFWEAGTLNITDYNCHYFYNTVELHLTYKIHAKMYASS